MPRISILLTLLEEELEVAVAGGRYVYGEQPRTRMSVISFAKARSCDSKGGMLFMAYVIPIEPIKLFVEDVAVVKELLDVFLDELPGLPPIG
ncbi:hypothetical protein L2E82_30254 [Cichorium intybus]|uniref:Uncharacterized protein n=1 Tax=Cichorium intybus TaxID=13427 RepID=A0ACB9D0J2_CICIN|nr:hypothetical protein L2E82_30254 [Cichorium intybus]